jgi:hypothetical protein
VTIFFAITRIWRKPKYLLPLACLFKILLSYTSAVCPDNARHIFYYNIAYKGLVAPLDTHGLASATVWPSK